MDPYAVAKWLHILSSTVLFGTGIGTAFQMVWAMRTGRVRSPARIVALLEAAGFGRVAEVPTALPFAARVVTGYRL